MSINDSSTVAEARAFVMERRWDTKGVRCPCCEQTAKVYKRTITGAIAKILCAMYISGPTEMHNIPDLMRKVGFLHGTPSQGGDWAKARFWGILELEPGVRDDGSTRVGNARLTQDGIDFVLGHKDARKYALVYNNELVGWVEGCGSISIHRALPKTFNYHEIMQTAAR